MRRVQPLFSEYLEFVDRRVFDAEYAEFWKRCVGGRHGIYVLFRRRSIYYVGIAADLWSRLRQHLNDRHGGRWDRISVYLTTDPARLRELESLLHHVLRPIFAGNKQVGRLSGTIDLLRPFMQAVKQEQDRKRKGLVGIPLLVRDKKRPEPKTATIPAVARYSRGLECGPAESCCSLVLSHCLVPAGAAVRELVVSRFSAQHPCLEFVHELPIRNPHEPRVRLHPGLAGVLLEVLLQHRRFDSCVKGVERNGLPLRALTLGRDPFQLFQAPAEPLVHSTTPNSRPSRLWRRRLVLQARRGICLD